MRKDYRHFGARSTVKIGPAKRHHTAGHHVMAKTDLRAGIVKARRPRARAGGAKRRALHGVEHRSNINCVMASASNVAMIVDTSCTSNWATTNAASGCVIACGTSAVRGPGFPARAGPDCPEDLRSVPRTCGPDSRRFRDRPQRLRRPTQDTDGHGVSDPSGHSRGHFQRAHRGRSRHVSCSDRGTGACAVGGKERRPSCWCRAPHGGTCRQRIGYRRCWRESVGRVVAAGLIFSDALGRTTSISEVVPQVVLCCWCQATSTRGER